jgi:hypothetical protein
MTDNSEAAQVRRRLAERRAQAQAAEVESIRAELAAERAEQKRLAERRRELEAAQARAREAAERAAAIVGELQRMTAPLVERTRELQGLRQQVARGVHFEAYGVRDGLIERPTLSTALAVPSELAGRMIKIGHILAMLSGVSLELAEIRARQMEL